MYIGLMKFIRENVISIKKISYLTIIHIVKSKLMNNNHDKNRYKTHDNIVK